ncbi:MAG: helix-turn-helix transcriptional regulator [Firmicutes bacterium]|nr:helix-turn-helix transcriptional regulator [Bacillota bacterium]
MPFGDRLRDLRNENDLKQKDLGKIIGVAKSTVSQWESGGRTPDASTLIKLADFFKVSVDYLLDRTNYSLMGDDLKEWREIIEKAASSGIKPVYIKHFIETHVNLAADMAKKK